MVKKIISGGQTGAHQAALDVAINLGISHGGWISKEHPTEAGTLPEKYNLKEMPLAGYPESTEQNVMDSDGTLVISHGTLSGESLQIIKYADRHKKELLHINLEINRGFSAAQLIKSWIVLNGIKVLNVAGPPSSKDPEIYDDTVRLLKAVHHLFFIDDKKSAPDNLKPFYPRTVEKAVDRLFHELPFKVKTQIAKLKENELDLLYSTLGTYIKKDYGLQLKSGELMKDCHFISKGKNLHADAAAALIINTLWRKLRKTHALRVVK